jgi:hypothetical protein
MAEEQKQPVNSACDIVAEWNGGEHRFCIGKIKQLQALQEATGAGPEELLSRLRALPEDAGGVYEAIRIGMLRPAAMDLHHIVEQGLIGGGMSPMEARKLVKVHVDERPRAESYALCVAIILALITGAPAQKKTADEPETGTAAGSSTSESSTAEPT